MGLRVLSPPTPSPTHKLLVNLHPDGEAPACLTGGEGWPYEPSVGFFTRREQWCWGSSGTQIEVASAFPCLQN